MNSNGQANPPQPPPQGMPPQGPPPPGMPPQGPPPPTYMPPQGMPPQGPPPPGMPPQGPPPQGMPPQGMPPQGPPPPGQPPMPIPPPAPKPKPKLSLGAKIGAAIAGVAVVVAGAAITTIVINDSSSQGHERPKLGDLTLEDPPVGLVGIASDIVEADPYSPYVISHLGNGYYLVGRVEGSRIEQVDIPDELAEINANPTEVMDSIVYFSPEPFVDPTLPWHRWDIESGEISEITAPESLAIQQIVAIDKNRQLIKAGTPDDSGWRTVNQRLFLVEDGDIRWSTTQEEVDVDSCPLTNLHTNGSWIECQYEPTFSLINLNTGKVMNGFGLKELIGTYDDVVILSNYADGKIEIYDENLDQPVKEFDIRVDRLVLPPVPDLSQFVSYENFISGLTKIATGAAPQIPYDNGYDLYRIYSDGEVGVEFWGDDNFAVIADKLYRCGGYGSFSVQDASRLLCLSDGRMAAFDIPRGPLDADAAWEAGLGGDTSQIDNAYDRKVAERLGVVPDWEISSESRHIDIQQFNNRSWLFAVGNRWYIFQN